MTRSRTLLDRTDTSLLLSLLAVILLAACGSSSPSTRRAAPKPAPEPTEPAPSTPERPLDFDGRWVNVGTEFEIVGYEGVGVRGADVVIAVRRTNWTELELEGETFREGSAELDLLTPAGTDVVEVGLGEAHDLGGHHLKVTYVGDTWDEYGRAVPHAKLIVTRK